MLRNAINTLLSYWSQPMLAANGIILLHLFGSAITGLVIGYERTYHGRAAGMRTYALVCMASTALTVMSGSLPCGTAACTWVPLSVIRLASSRAS